MEGEGRRCDECTGFVSNYYIMPVFGGVDLVEQRVVIEYETCFYTALIITCCL